MIYAGVKNSIVVNCLVFKIEPVRGHGFDDLIDITDMSPRPGIGWSFTDGEFSLPIVDLLAEWETSMAEHDRLTPQWVEDLFDLYTGAKTVDDLPELAQKVADKKELRRGKP